TFRDETNDVIGHRRCRALHPVAVQFDGVYAFGGTLYEPQAGGRQVYIEAMTDFDDASDVAAAFVEIAVGADLAPGVKPGQLWLQPDDLSGGNPIAVTPVSLPLRPTVREQIKFIV